LNAVLLPFTDLKVFPICLGTVPLGSTLNRAESFRLLDAYLEAGGNFIDTAKVYSDWLPGERSTSETTIGAWLAGNGSRGRVILSTKGGHPDLTSMSVPRLSPAEIVGDLESSLRRLGTGTIDLYWLHRDDPARPVGEMLETLAAQARAGKIRYYGCSNWSAARLREAQAYAQQHNLPGFAANQMLWSLAAIEPGLVMDKTLAFMDEAMHQYHRESGLAAIPYTSQANGLFSKLTDGRQTLEKAGMFNTPRNARRLERIHTLAQQTGLSLTQIVLGYLTAQPFVTVPIIGPRTGAQLADSLTALQARLTAEQVLFLEA
jgi:aryl-alcohol dehydrogenase-like predicted oxidoreductase